MAVLCSVRNTYKYQITSLIEMYQYDYERSLTSVSPTCSNNVTGRSTLPSEENERVVTLSNKYNCPYNQT
jgi:hypothetical protein